MTPTESRDEIARLRAEVDRLRTELANAREVRGEGTGGSGADLEETPVASAELQGRVRMVSGKKVEVVDWETGESYELLVDENTRASRAGRRIPVERILAGSDVRATFDFIADGDNVAKRIEVIPRK